MSHTEQMREAPEIVARVMRYAGQTMRTARNPNITARECIELADWIKAALTALRQRRRRRWGSTGQHWTEREPVRLKQSRAGRVYVAGPMTGLPDLNFPAFNAEAAILRAQGLTVINPAEHGIVKGAEWADYLRHDIAGLVSCERIHLLRGWEKSKGARLEFQIATELGMEVTHQVEPT